MIITAQAVSLIYQFWIHTETIRTLGPLEAVLNTPSHHRVHHGSNLKYLDRNHGGIFIFWDKLFGTFQQEEDPVTYGLTKNINTFNPIRIAFHEWQSLWQDVKKPNPWHVRAGYLLNPPGWSPDGSTLTANQLRSQQAAAGGGATPRVS
jgi:hypothetical protein